MTCRASVAAQAIRCNAVEVADFTAVAARRRRRRAQTLERIHCEARRDHMIEGDISFDVFLDLYDLELLQTIRGRVKGSAGQLDCSGQTLERAREMA